MKHLYRIAALTFVALQSISGQIQTNYIDAAYCAKLGIVLSHPKTLLDTTNGIQHDKPLIEIFKTTPLFWPENTNRFITVTNVNYLYISTNYSVSPTETAIKMWAYDGTLCKILNHKWLVNEYKRTCLVCGKIVK